MHARSSVDEPVIYRSARSCNEIVDRLRMTAGLPLTHARILPEKKGLL